MATIDVEIASRRYSAAIDDRQARQATDALGSLSEVRQLLFASLLLADEVKEHRAGNPPPPEPDPRVADALARLAERMERLAQRLETDGQTS